MVKFMHYGQFMVVGHLMKKHLVLPNLQMEAKHLLLQQELLTTSEESETVQRTVVLETSATTPADRRATAATGLETAQPENRE